VAKRKGGLTKWFGENWVDISAPKKSGGYKQCGRSSASDSDRGYPKCVPSSKAASMSEKEIASAVRRKRSKKQGVGGKPTNVATFAAEGGSAMKMKGYKMGGSACKRMAKGGMVNQKPAGKMRPPSSQKCGLYGHK
jgi:hypothetical protein